MGLLERVHKHGGEKRRDPNEMRAPSGGDRTVTVNGREYKVLTSADQLGRMLSRGQAAALAAPWKEVAEQHLAVQKANNAAGGQEVPSEDVLVACTSCYWRLNSNGLRLLVMSSMMDLGMGFRVAEAAEQMQELREGRCPQCANAECYYICDPAGFAKSEPQLA